MENTAKNSEIIDQIAIRLADAFVKQVYQFYDHKSYTTYKRSMSEILHWAYEFSIEYPYRLKNWDFSEESNNNRYQASEPEDFLIRWGKERMGLFLKQHGTKNFFLSDPHVRMLRMGAPPGLYVSI